MDQNNNSQYVFEAGLNAAPVRQLNLLASTAKSEHPFVVLPQNSQLKSLESFLPAPLRLSQCVQFQNPASFARYVKTFANKERTQVFARNNGNTGGEFKAVLDYHTTENPSWCSHVALYQCPLSPLFTHWKSKDNVYMPQREFAEWIESNTAQIEAPPAAEFLEIAQTLTARTSVSYTGVTRLADGRDQVAFESLAETKAGEKGNFTLPSQFKLLLPVFDGDIHWRFTARLRHRVSHERKLELKFELVNPQLTIREAWDRLVADVQKQTGIEAYLGSC